MGGGVAASAGDIAGLARSIAELMSDDAMCQRIGTAALAFARQELTPEVHLANLERAYGEIGAA